MNVLVTGGTGFVGSHTVAELVRSGHGVKLLVRSPERIQPALSPFGVVDQVAYVTGDVTDQSSVEGAMEGVDSVIHCASIYSMDPRMDSRIRATNVKATEIILRAAQGRGLDPIIHVSSFVALLGERNSVIHPGSQPGEPPGAYFRSKADSDAVARRFQETGAPVTITYPGSVWGPDDPHFGESCQMVKNILYGFYTFSPPGGFPISDVRDIARLHSVLLEPGQGARRYMGLSVALEVKDVIRKIARLTGRNLPAFTFPAKPLLGLTSILDKMQAFLPFRLPINYQLIYVPYINTRVDDSLTREHFGIEPRNIDETITDTVRWMVKTGKLSASLAGNIFGP